VALEGLLWCIAALLGAGIGGIVIGRHRAATVVVYAITLCITTIALLISGISLLIPDSPGTALTLPVGLPWLGAHFRLDALSAFFLVVVNLGGATANLFGLGYGRHEEAPARVLPFFPAFLAGMNLVVIADDAFTFLFTWSDFLFALTLTTTEDVRPVTLGLFTYIGTYVKDWSAVMATAVLASLPAFVLLLVAQRFVAAGVTSGSIK